MFNIESARKLLNDAGVFFSYDPEDEDTNQKMAQTLNLNDVWCWACADGEYVTDEELPRVAELFFRYGWAGILYWVSERSEGKPSEFHDNNRFIEFVRQEEQLRKDVPDFNERAYKKIRYTLGSS